MAAPGGARRRPLLLLLFAGLVHGASAVFVVKNGNGTACIMADFSATFLTSYDTRSGPQNKSFELPAGAEVSNSSSCGKENASDSSLVITFGRGHTLTLIFTRNATRYEVQLMRFAYNLSDTDTFPNSSSTGVKTVESATDIKADINKTYRCVSETQVNMDNVTVTLRDAAIQAYLSSSNFSREETRCEQDLPTPTTPPQPAPTPAPASPAVFRYNVSGSNGTCLLASMGLQLNVTYRTVDNKTVTREFNVNPNKTTFGGNCSATLATLELHSENLLLLALQFVMNESSSRVFLQGVQLNLTLPDAKEGSFTATNSSLRALQATAGNSYKCNAEQRLRVTSSFSLNMFRVWLQAFRVDGDKFGPDVLFPAVLACILKPSIRLVTVLRLSCGSWESLQVPVPAPFPLLDSSPLLPLSVLSDVCAFQQFSQRTSFRLSSSFCHSPSLTSTLPCVLAHLYARKSRARSWTPTHHPAEHGQRAREGRGPLRRAAMAHPPSALQSELLRRGCICAALA